jgi:[protein-PII] uridylyltransferase
MAGILSAWGMNIVKADAFSNAAGIIVDTFQFTDTYRTLELNASEIDRFLEHSRRGEAQSLRRELLRLAQAKARPRPKVTVETRPLEFDNEASSHSTLVQIVTQDTPGLLREIALSLASCGCNIEGGADRHGRRSRHRRFLSHQLLSALSKRHESREQSPP